MTLSPAQLRTLGSLAQAFVPACDPDRVAAQAAEALVRAADPAQVAQLRLVLATLETPLANRLITRRWRAFSDLGTVDREAVLRNWATSAVPQRRAAFQAFRKLLTFLAYADPGEAGAPNPLPGAIGYVPDMNAVTADPTPIRTLDVDRSDAVAGTPLVLDADVVVVGSGAGGGVVAAELAQAGRSVLVLEAGPFVDEAAMPRDELDAYSRVYLNHGLLSTWDASITFLAGSGVGGGTLVNWMTCIDVPDDVRAEWATEHGLDGVGPGDDAEWTADVATIERQLGVAPSTVVPPKDQLILHGARALGWDAGLIRRNARDCGTCGSCPFGCVAGAKQSGIRVHLREAWSAGARILDRVRVTRVLVEAGGGRVTGVEGRLLVTDPYTGMPIIRGGDPTAAEVRKIIVRAPQVVLAAGALRSPAVLQGSRLDHPAIGRYLRVHPVSVVAARLREPVDMWRGTMQAARSLEFIRGDATRRGYVIESAPGHLGLLALALPWSSAADHASRMGDARHIAPLISITRDGGEGRASLTRAGRVRLDYRLDRLGVATLRHGLAAMARIALASGQADEILGVGTPMAVHRAGSGGEAAFLGSLEAMDFSPNRGAVFSAHQMGSVRMGASAADHAADPRGRVRRGRGSAVVRGLYVADGSTFPTGIGVNPMLPIMAMARRVSRTILAESGSS